MNQQDGAADRLASEMASLQENSAAQSAAETAITTEAPEPVQVEPEQEQATGPAASDQPEDGPRVEPVAPAASHDGADRLHQPPPVSKVSTILLPAIVGAVAAVLVAGAAMNGMVPGLAPPPSATAPQGDNAEMAALASRVAALESRPAPAAAGVADPALAGRIDAVEKSVASLRDDVAAARSQSEQLASAVNALKAAPVAAPSPDQASDLAAINGRLDQLEAAVQSAKDSAQKAAAAKAAEPAPASADDVPLRRLVAATLLDLAVRNGEPYAATLDSAKPLATDPAALTPLDRFAKSGLPSAAELSRDVLPLLPKLLPEEQAPGSTTGFVARLQANAERLVKIERAGAVAGIDRSGIVSKAAVAAQRNDLAAVRRELNTLAPAQQKPVQSWLDKVEARDQALAASHQFAAAALAALPKSSP
ncbi:MULTISPECIES: hypothetical protein [Rhodopseudomonas]|uniref:COG4223 family protein n=1 Tax=Rhodopseudomonas TaxID=1073 RepID=UPI00128CD78F|nr:MULTISPECIES: hypothetical protein [Rhodopseudomonas]MDF3811394.1 hypothetical protein [Rhodopseudomonas sp. BAL398]WOK16309.1 hypothetical protein RBJ75_19395 [Rhodopseudomonas sp. BAL398]